MASQPWEQRNRLQDGINQEGGTGFYASLLHRNTININQGPNAPIGRQDSFMAQSSPPQLPARDSPNPSIQDRLPTVYDFQVGWITALDHELAASLAALDDRYHLDFEQSGADHNTYIFGRIGRHYIAMVCLPSYGTNAAAFTVTNMMRTFPSLQYCLMVGIGGGVPSDAHDIRLGDVVVSSEVVQYEIGKIMPGGNFQKKAVLNNPPPKLLGAVRSLKATHTHGSSAMNAYLNIITRGNMAGYCRPDGPDQLHRAGKLVQRPRRLNQEPVVHFGKIASGDKVVASEEDRERLRANEDILCFEMEAAGIMNIIPCLAIRGICDYCNENKSNMWQNYAAAVAASYAKELLATVVSSRASFDDRSPFRAPPLAHSQTWNRPSSPDPQLGNAYVMQPPRAMTIDQAIPRSQPYHEVNPIPRATTWDDSRSTNAPPGFVVDFSLAGLQQEAKLFGRDDEMAELESFFSPLTIKDRPPQPRKIFVLHGAPGVGKSALCTNFVRRYHQNYDAVIWVDGSSPNTITQSIRAFVKKPEVSGGKDFEDSGDDQVAQYLLDWLKIRANTRWLLCFDNVDACNYNLENLLPDADHGSVIVTGTLSSLRRLGNSSRELGFLDDYDSRRLLAAHVEKSVENDVDAEALLRKLRGLPIALKCAGKFVKDRARTFSNYNDQYNRGWASLMSRQDKHMSLHYGGRLNSMSDLYMSSHSQLKRQDSQATHLLGLWPFLAYNRLRYQFFEPVWGSRSSPRNWPGWLRSLVQSEQHFDDVLSELTQVHLAHRQMHGEQSFYSIHPSFHDWCFYHVLIPDRTACFEACKLAGALIACQVLPSKLNDAYLQTHIKLFPHARQVYERSKFTLENTPAGMQKLEMDPSILCQLGTVLQDNSEFHAAVDIFRRACDAHALRPDLVDARAIRSNYNLGQALGRCRMLEAATSTLKKSLEMAETILGVDDPLAVRIRLEIGKVKQKQFEYPAAYEMLRAGLDYAQANPRPDRLLRSDAHLMLCNFHHDQREHAEAIRQCELALASLENLVSPDSMVSLMVVQSIGAMYVEIGQQAQSVRYFKRVGEGLHNALGGDAELQSALAQHLGFLYKEEGKADLASDHFRKALRLSEELQDSSTTVSVLASLGAIYRAQKAKRDEAERIFERALRACESRGPGDRFGLRVKYNIALLCRDRVSEDAAAAGRGESTERSARFDRARAMCDLAYMGYRDALGPGYHYTVHMAHVMASLYRERGDLDRAREWCKRALDGCETQLGDTHSQTIKAAHKLLDVYRELARQGDQRYETEKERLARAYPRRRDTPQNG